MTLRRRKKRPAPTPPPVTKTTPDMHFTESHLAEMPGHRMASSTQMTQMHSSYSSHMTHKQFGTGHMTSHLHSSHSASNHLSHITSQLTNGMSHTVSQVSNHMTHSSFEMTSHPPIHQSHYKSTMSGSKVKVEEEHVYEPVEAVSGVYKQKNLSQSLNSFLEFSSDNNSKKQNENNNGSSCTLNSLAYNSEFSSNDDVFSDAKQCDNDPPYTVTVVKAEIEKKKPPYVNVDIDKQRTLSASAIEENMKWNSVPIDFSQEDSSYVSSAEIARRKRDRVLNPVTLNKAVNSDSSIHKSDPDLATGQRKHFRKNRKSPRFTGTRDCSDQSSNSSASIKTGIQKKKVTV